MSTQILSKLFVFIVCAPLLSGVIAKIKNNLRMRRGQSIFQPYYNLIKLFSKEEVISENTSWVFKFTPFIVLSSVLAVIVTKDVLVLIFLFALARFFMALAAIDTGSSFTGMGSSRESFISGLAEPVLCLIGFSVFLQRGSTLILAFTPATLTASSILCAGALFLVTLAETSRMPVDNQETHLELTMIHEAMLLEYSGKSLALIELASHIKQMILFFLISWVIFPSYFANLWYLWYPGAILLILVAVGLVEVLMAKMRLFRITDFLGLAFVLAMISAVCAVLRV